MSSLLFAICSERVSINRDAEKRHPTRTLQYQETLFGHTSPANGIAAYVAERCVSVGSDQTARLWKLAEQTQLLYRGRPTSQSVDCVSCFNDEWWATGDADGQVALWHLGKKKAVQVVRVGVDR